MSWDATSDLGGWSDQEIVHAAWGAEEEATISDALCLSGDCATTPAYFAVWFPLINRPVTVVSGSKYNLK
jgi:hypothetical protein